MFEIKPTQTQTLDQVIDQLKANGYYVATKTDQVDGKTIATSYALTLDEYMLSQGIKSVEAQDKVLADLMGQMQKQTKSLTDINDVLQAINNILTSKPEGGVSLDSATQSKIAALVPDLLSKDTVYTGSLSREQLETLQKNLSTAQSSQGALNEDISLKLNEAASKRSAIFTQLQTLLQTIMQTRSALARW